MTSVSDLEEALCAITDATDYLTSYLLDNTEKGFEEVPEVDSVRTELFELHEQLYKFIAAEEALNAKV